MLFLSQAQLFCSPSYSQVRPILDSNKLVLGVHSAGPAGQELVWIQTMNQIAKVFTRVYHNSEFDLSNYVAGESVLRVGINFSVHGLVCLAVLVSGCTMH
jgi:hypothetical protein